jgi:hypothetical protein
MISTANLLRRSKISLFSGARQIDFLRAHYRSPGRALTATRLAQAVRYNGYRGINLLYGKLAVKIGKECGYKKASLDILVHFVRP